jgi:hypothetical protein
MNTNIEAVFNLLLTTALREGVKKNEMPETLYIFSDMEFDRCITTGPASRDRYGSYNSPRISSESHMETLLEGIARKWAANGFELPRVVFWNLNARQDNIPAMGGRFSYVSGFSMNMVEQILSGHDGYDLMMAKLNTERYSVIC